MIAKYFNDLSFNQNQNGIYFIFRKTAKYIFMNFFAAVQKMKCIWSKFSNITKTIEAETTLSNDAEFSEQYQH